MSKHVALDNCRPGEHIAFLDLENITKGRVYPALLVKVSECRLCRDILASYQGAIRVKLVLYPTSVENRQSELTKSLPICVYTTFSMILAIFDFRNNFVASSSGNA